MSKKTRPLTLNQRWLLRILGRDPKKHLQQPFPLIGGCIFEGDGTFTQGFRGATIEGLHIRGLLLRKGEKRPDLYTLSDNGREIFEEIEKNSPDLGEVYRAEYTPDAKDGPEVVVKAIKILGQTRTHYLLADALYAGGGAYNEFTSITHQTPGGALFYAITVAEEDERRARNILVDAVTKTTRLKDALEKECAKHKSGKATLREEPK